MCCLMDSLSHRRMPLKQMVTWMRKVSDNLSCSFLCPCVKSFFFFLFGSFFWWRKVGSYHSEMQTKTLKVATEQEVEVSLTLMACDRGNWTMIGCWDVRLPRLWLSVHLLWDLNSDELLTDSFLLLVMKTATMDCIANLELDGKGGCESLVVFLFVSTW